MRWLTFWILHLTAAILGTAAFWWFVLPEMPAEAVVDGMTAAALAGYGEIIAVRWGG
ncbi:MAG TPA: hypothetical protein VE420_08685 [Gemmatimonadales bacterium]|nr:hypothetical protein [Gemmatimonadales bacterium]